MEIQLKIKDNYKKIYLDKYNIILGSNATGKTNILNTIVRGLEGKEEYFLINGINISKGMYDFIYIDENRDIDGELTMKSKSYIKNKKIKLLILNKEDHVSEITNDYIERMNRIFAEEEYNYLHSQTKLVIDNNKMNKLDNIILELLNSEQLSKGAKEEFYIMQRLQQVNNELNTIVIIDDIDRYLDNKTIYNILEIMKLKNIKLICSTKNKYILNEIKFNKIFDVFLNEIKLEELSKINMFKKYYKEEITSLTFDDYIMQNEELFLKNDYETHLKKEKINIISDLKI